METLPSYSSGNALCSPEQNVGYRRSSKQPLRNMEGNPSVEDGWREMNILLCPKCNLKTSDPALFQAHHCKPKSMPAVVSYNRENDKYTCCICKVELSESEFSPHLEIHISKHPYKCGYCNTKASSPIDMQQHLVHHHGGSVYKYFLQLSQTTKEVMLKAKNNGRAIFKPLDKVLLDQAASGKNKSVTNTARSQASVAVSEASQVKITATPLLPSVPPPLNAGHLVPPVIQQAALGVHSHIPSLQIYNARTCSTRSDQQRFILPAPKTFPQNASLATSSSENIFPNPASLPYTQTQIPDLFQGLASSRIQERQPFVSNNLPIYGQGGQFCITDTQMASTAPLGFVSKVLDSTVPPAARIIDGTFRNSSLGFSSFSHQHVINNGNTVNLELSVANGSRIMSLLNDSNTTTSEGYPAVSNLSAHAQQGCSETTLQRNVSPTVVNSDRPTRIIIQNVMSLPAKEDECEQNLALGTTLNDEPTTTNVREQESTEESENFSFLRVVKVYFLCLKCRIKWRNEYDLFFKHIWQKHVHKMDFSCCPMGYSTDCVRLKAVVRAIYDKSQEPMSDEIRSYFNQNSVDSCTDSENTLSPEQCIYPSTVHSNPVCVSSSSKTKSQPDVQSTSATSMNQRHIPPQNLSVEAFSCREESCPPNTAFNYQTQLRAPAVSYAWENVQNKITTDLASENEGSEASLPSLDQVVRRLTPSEAIASTAGVVETLRCLPEQQLLNASTKTLKNASVSSNSRHQESKMPATIYEDISNDGIDFGRSSSNVHGSNILLCNDQYTDDLPLDLSKKAPQIEISVIPTPPLSVNESHTTCTSARMDRISTESLEITDDNETTLKFFYQCGFHGCLFAAHKSLDFQAHYQQTHVSENQFPCIYCGFRNSSSKHLIDHMEEHIRNTKSKTFSCSLLQNSDKVVHVENNDIKFILRMLSTSFDANSDSGVDLRCTCNICCSEFGSLEELDDHLHKSLLKVIECKHCNSHFLNCYSWQRHMITEHPDLPRMYNINKKLLCYDRKMNTISTDTETSRNEFETNLLRNKSESQNMNQSNDMSPVQTECEERIHMVLPVHSQNKGINYPQDSVNSRPIHLMETSSRRLETPFTFMNTLKSSDATNNTDDFRTNLQKAAVSDRRDISYGNPLTNTDSSRKCINYGQQLTNAVIDYGQPLTNAVNDYGQPLTKTVSDYGQPQTHTVHARRDSHDNDLHLASVSIRTDSYMNEPVLAHNVSNTSDSYGNGQHVTSVSSRRGSQDNGQYLTSGSSRRGSQDNGQHLARIDSQDNGQPLTSVSSRRGIYMNKPVLAHIVSNIRDSYGNEQPTTLPVISKKDNSVCEQSLTRRDSQDNGKPLTSVSSRRGSQDNGQHLTRIDSQDNGQQLTRIDSQDNWQHLTRIDSQDNGQHLTSVSARRDSQDNGQHLTRIDSQDNLQHLTSVSTRRDSQDNGQHLTRIDSQDNRQHLTRIGSQDNGQHLTRIDSQDNLQHLTSVSTRRDSQDNGQHLTRIDSQDNRQHLTRIDSQDNRQHLTSVSSRRGNQDNGQHLTRIDSQDNGQHLTRIGSQDNGQHLTRIDSQDNRQHLTSVSTRRDSQDNGQTLTSVSSRRGNQDNGQHLTSVSTRRDSQDNGQPLTSVSTRRGIYMNKPVLAHIVSNIRDSYGNEQPTTLPVISKKDNSVCEQSLTQTVSVRADNKKSQTQMHTINILDGSLISSLNPEVSEHTLPKITEELITDALMISENSNSLASVKEVSRVYHCVNTTLEQGIGRTNCCEIINSEHTSSTPNGVQAMDDDLKSSDELNLNSSIVTDDQRLTHELDIPPVAVNIPYSSNQTPESLHTEKEQTSVKASDKIQHVAEMCTSVAADTQCSLVSVCEKDVQQPAILAPCIKQLPERELTSNKPDENEAMFQQGDGDLVLDIPIYQSTECSQKGTPKVSNLTVIHHISAAVETVEDRGLKHKVGSGSCLSQINNNNLTLDLGSVDLLTGGHISNERSNKEVACLVHSQNSGGEGTVATETIENMNLDTESSPGLQQDFSQSKTQGLGAKPIKRNKLSNINNSIPSKSNTTVKTEEHTRYSDLSGNSTVLEKNHKEELLTPPKATQVKETVLHELSTSNKARNNVSNSIKNTDSNPILNMQKFKQSGNSHHAVLPQKPPIQTKNYNSLDLAHCKCGSGNQDYSAKDNQSGPNTDQSHLKMASKKCGKCRFTALWNKSTLKSNTSSQLTQKASPASQQISQKARITGKSEPSELHCTLFDQCGSAVLDKCLKPLYEFTGGIYVCKGCKQKVLTMKRIHCHNFYCQGNVGVAHCSVCPFQGENGHAVEVHIKNQHGDRAPNITVKFRCILPSELMKILQSQPISSDTFMDVCAKLPLSKHASNNGVNPLVIREIASEDRPLFINLEEGGSSKGMKLNSAEKAQENMNTKGRKVSPKKADSVKMNTLITSTNIVDCTSALSPTVKSHNLSTTLSVISENGKQAKMQEISTVLLSDKVIPTQNLDTLTAGTDEENRTPDISSSEQINNSIYNAPPLKRMLHNKGASEARKLNHCGSGVKRKSECTSEEISAKKTTSSKEETAKSFGGLVDSPSDKDSMPETNNSDNTTNVSETNNSDNTTNVNSKYKLLKEKSKDKCVEGIQNSELSKLDHTNTGTSVCKQSENRHDKGVGTSKTIRTIKDIAASCKNTAPMIKSKSNSKSSEIIRPIEEMKMCKRNPLVNEQEKTPEVMCSASEISSVVQTISSVVRFDDTISVKDADLSDKEKVRHEATRTRESTKSATMDVISHADTAGGTKSENRHIKKVISNAFKSARENKINQSDNKKSVPKLSDTEINDNGSAVTRKLEKSLSAEDTAAKTTNSVKPIKIRLKQKFKDRQDEVIGAHISKLDNNVQVKFSDTTVERKPKGTTAGLDEHIGTECVDITCSTQSDGGISAQKTTSCNTNSKDNCSVTTGNRQLIDSGSRKSSTTGMTPSDNKENNNTEKGLSGSKLDKDGQETLKAVKVAKLSEEVSVKHSNSAARGKSQNRRDGDTIASETAKTDSNTVFCNDITEKEHEREGTKSVTSRENIKVSHSGSVARKKTITVKQKGMSDSKSSKVIKEMRLTHNDTDIRKSINHPKSAEIKNSNSQVNDSDSTDRRKSLEGLDDRITSHEIMKLVDELDTAVELDTVEALDTFEELDNAQSGTEVLQPSENGYSERTRFPEDQQSDKLAKVICSDKTEINQLKSKHEDLSCIQTTGPCKKIKVSHDSSVEIKTKDANDENVEVNKISQITKGTRDLSGKTAVKRKSEERLEKPSKQCKSEAVQFPNKAHDTDLDILDPTPNTNFSVGESTVPCPSQALKNHIKPNKNKSLSRVSASSSQPISSSSVQLVPSSSSQPVPSKHLARKKRNDIYRCLNHNCDFTCKWNIDTMRGHINSKHPYFSCGYCDAPYTLTLLLENHQKFVHRGMEPNIRLGTISLNLLFKKINNEHSNPCGNGNMEVSDNRSQLLESSPKRKTKKPKTNSDCQLTVSKNTEKQGLSLNLEGNVRSKQPIGPDVGNKVPSRISEKVEEEDESQAIPQARKAHTDMRKQSKPESSFEQLQMEVQLASGHEETATEKLTNFFSINATTNGNPLSAKADRNLFERSSFMNNAQFYLEASNASKNNNNKGINMANTEGNIAGKTATFGIPLAKIFKLRLPEGIRLNKSVQKEPVSLHDFQLTERKIQSNNDLNEQNSLVSLSDVSKTTVSMENLPQHETVYQDALKGNSESPLTSKDAYNLNKTAVHPKMSRSAAFFIKNNKLAKFKSASTINNFETYSQRRLPSVKIKKSQDLRLIDISQASNLSPGNINDHNDRQKAQRMPKTIRKDLSEDTNTPNKAMAAISSLKVGSEQNCGTWTVNQMETKTAAEGVQNIAFEPENMRLNFRKESLHNRSNLTTHSLSSSGKKPPTKDAVLGAASGKGKREASKTEYPFRCTLCRRIVKCLNDIEEHFLECHPTDMVQLTERISGLVYSSSGELLDRKNCRKVPGLSHMCKYCPFRSTKRSDVEDHISVAHPLKNVLVFSLGKPRSPMHETGTEITFEAQAPGSNSSTPAYYHCIMCDSVERSEFLFRLHLAKHSCFKHTTVISTDACFVCPACGYIAKSNTDLAQHTGEHMSERRFKCFMCEHDSHNKPGVKIHIRNVHNISIDDDSGIIDRKKKQSFDSRPRLVNINPSVVLERLQPSCGYTVFLDS